MVKQTTEQERKEKNHAYMKIYHSKPKNKTKRKAYQSTPKAIVKLNACINMSEFKAKISAIEEKRRDHAETNI